MNRPSQGTTFQLHIDGAQTEACAEETLLDVARRAGAHVPTLCHFAGAEPFRSCSVCLVGLEGRPGLVLACATRATAGQRVVTDSEVIRLARRTAVELLVSEHNGECLAPCERACPATWDIPGFMAAMPGDDPAVAARIAREGLALPVTLGYVCQGQCHKPCRRTTRGEPVAIQVLHRDPLLGADEVATRPTVQPPSGRRVAVVGAGPAGLAATSRLLQAGHACDVYDSRDRAGGTLLDEPEERLPAAALAAEVAGIVAMGATLHLAADVALEALRADYDAVLLTVGTPQALIDLGLDVPNPKRFADPRTRATAHPGLFVAGGAGRRGKLAIRAVADGQAAADSIDQLLRGVPVTGPERPVNVRYDDLDDETLDLLFSVALEPEHAGGGPERCLQCGCRAEPSCELRQVATEVGASLVRLAGARRELARDASHEAVVHEPHKCILCGACVHIARESGASPGIAITGRGFAARVAAPYDDPLADAIDRETALKAAAACPTGAFRAKTPAERE